MKTHAEIQVAQAIPSPEGGGPPGAGLNMFFLLGAMVLFMYALIIRPEQRRRKEHKTMLSEMQRGDMIVTTGGLHGKVTGISDEILTVEIADRVKVKVSASAVTARVPVKGGESS